MLLIREAVEEDKPRVWEIIKSVISAGDTYVYSPDSSKEKMLAWWFGADKKLTSQFCRNRLPKKPKPPPGRMKTSSGPFT